MMRQVCFRLLLFQVTRNVTSGRVVKSCRRSNIPASLTYMMQISWLRRVSPDVLPEITRAIKEDANRIPFWEQSWRNDVLTCAAPRKRI